MSSVLVLGLALALMLPGVAAHHKPNHATGGGSPSAGPAAWTQTIHAPFTGTIEHTACVGDDPECDVMATASISGVLVTRAGADATHPVHVSDPMPSGDPIRCLVVSLECVGYVLSHKIQWMDQARAQAGVIARFDAPADTSRATYALGVSVEPWETSEETEGAVVEAEVSLVVWFARPEPSGDPGILGWQTLQVQRGEHTGPAQVLEFVFPDVTARPGFNDVIVQLTSEASVRSDDCAGPVCTEERGRALAAASATLEWITMTTSA